MANLQSTAITANGFVYPQAATHYGWGTYNSTSLTANQYIHIKTNWPRNNNAMCMIEADGYAYGMGQIVKASWCAYAYHETGTLLNIGLASLGGITAHGIYYSTDNFVVLRAFASSIYYTGFVLNSYNTAPSGSPGFRLAVVAIATNGTSGNHF